MNAAVSVQDAVRVPESQARRWGVDVFAAVGMRLAEAAVVSDSLVSADCRGFLSHGLMRTRAYVDRLRMSAIDPVAAPVVLSQSGPTMLIDGRNAMGQVVADFAIEHAIATARECGAGIACVRGSNHFGTCEYYALKASAVHMIGIVATVSATNIMAPLGGLEPLLGNNPLAVAVPTREAAPLVLDMAMSVAAGGKIRLAAKTGEPIPESWAFDSAGKPTTDAKEAIAGTVRPVGDHKGYGLSLIVAMLSAILSGAAFGRDVTDLYGDSTTAQNVGHFVQVIDVSRFADVEFFEREIDAAIELMHTARKAPGVERIFVPGEREHLRELEQMANGIRYPRKLIADLNALAADIGVRNLAEV